MIDYKQIKWSRVSDNVLETKTPSGITVVFCSEQGSRKGTFYGRRGYKGIVRLIVNHVTIYGCTGCGTWSEVKHLTAGKFEWLMQSAAYHNPEAYKKIEQLFGVKVDEA